MPSALTLTLDTTLSSQVIRNMVSCSTAGPQSRSWRAGGLRRGRRNFGDTESDIFAGRRARATTAGEAGHGVAGYLYVTYEDDEW